MEKVRKKKLDFMVDDDLLTMIETMTADHCQGNRSFALRKLVATGYFVLIGQEKKEPPVASRRRMMGRTTQAKQAEEFLTHV